MIDTPISSPSLTDENIEQLLERREIWNGKYPIRACYAKWVEMLKFHARPGLTIEVGGGSGLVKSLWTEQYYASDLLPTPWIDLAANALELPFANGSVDNIVCFDALHHFPDPHAFLDEATRALCPGGRILMIEPWISPISYFFYKFMHHEPICYTHYQDPELSEHDPWTGNLALANIVFKKEVSEWPERHPSLNQICLTRFSFFDFQVAGGFKPWALTRSELFYDFFLRLDDLLRPLMPLIAFRVMAVYGKE